MKKDKPTKRKIEKGILQLVKTNNIVPTLKMYLTRTKKGKKYKIGMELNRNDFARMLIANQNEDDGVACVVSVHTKNLDKLGRFGVVDPSDLVHKKGKKDA